VDFPLPLSLHAEASRHGSRPSAFPRPGKKAAAQRIALLSRLDPIEARNEENRRKALEAAKAVTFAHCATSYIESHKAGWRNVTAGPAARGDQNCFRPTGPMAPSFGMHCDYNTRDQARASLFDYLEVFYNRQRRHSTINYESPLAFEGRTNP